MKRATLIVNPVAGKMRVKSTFFEIVQKLCDSGYLLTVRITKTKGDAIDIAAGLKAEECDVVICAGGDGTLNEVICGIMRSGADIPIGYIPCGSTNDFAQSMNLSINPIAACEQIIKGEAKPFDIGMFAGKRNFSYIASFGAFTETSYTTPQQMKNALGHFAYVLESIKSLGNIKPYNVTTVADGKVVSGEYIFGAVANSTSIAGVLKLKADEVDMNDGKFEIILAKNPKTPQDLNELIGAVITANLSSPMLTYFKASKVEIRSSDNITWTLDGEQMDGADKIIIENLPNRIILIR